MQCQGTTRSGARCRNNSLNGELFCDVHMRVNKSRNLTLIVPGLLTILTCYFILFSLFLSNTTYAVFNIPYLQFVGLDDVFLNALKFAGVIGFAVVSLFALYSVFLIVFFCTSLIFHIIQGTRGKNISILETLSAIVLGLYVLIANMTLRLLSVIPGTGRIKGTKVEIKENRFSRAFLELRNKDGDLRKGRPLLSAKEALQSYLFFRNMGNHRFSVFTVLLILLTLVIYFTVLSEADRLKTCKSDPLNVLTADNYPSSAYQLFSPCPVQIKDGNLIQRGLASITHYLLPHSMILLNTSPTPASLLHIGSTSRFDLLFDPQTAKPVVLPKGINFPASQAASFMDIDPILDKIQAGFEKLNQYRLWVSQRLLDHEQRLDQVDQKLAKLEREINRSAKSANPQKPTGPSELAGECNQQNPDLIIAYKLNQSSIQNPFSLDQIRQFARNLRQSENLKIRILGYADPSGTDARNMELSRERAQGVARVLAQMGIANNRFEIYALGKNSSTNRPRRRVEIITCP